ncbi:Ig-like domain repeat protein [uncultured Pseudokineococcus sp.]|uniref:Ig-like domain repeat protein n=1 Tax=uncultured Pseudokineococcus sp. TaxID=1642928 RepID=UPI00261008D2|nr:Ig-like domain repeat protein [uncultured Pseudokineococcus sp.]
MTPARPRRRGALPALAAVLAAGLVLPLSPAPSASADTGEPSALLTGELLLVADEHRGPAPSGHPGPAPSGRPGPSPSGRPGPSPSGHDDHLAASLRLPGGLVVPVDADAVERVRPGSCVTLEVPVPEPVVDAVEAGRRVPVPDDDAPSPLSRTGAPVVERTTIRPAALAASVAQPAPATSDLAAATAVALATAGEEPDPARLVSATAPALVSATGAPRQVTAVVVSLGGRDVSRYTDAEVSRIVGSSSDFWAEQSGGTVTFAQSGPTLRYTSALSCSQYNALWDEAAARAGFTPGPDRHLTLFLPEGAGCAYGLGSVGAGPSSGGVSYVSAPSWPALAHEWGHNMSLLHADRAVCGAAMDSRSCTEVAYGDLPDVMASTSTPYAAGNASAVALGRLGLLGPDDRRTVTATGVTSVPLAPLSDHAGVRSLSVVDPRSGTTYYLENRQPAGRDTYGWAGYPGQTFGLRVLRSSAAGGTVVLDASPTSGGRDPDVVVGPGATFTSAAGGLQVRSRVDATGAVTALVSVAPTGVAHWLTGPFASTVAPAAVTPVVVDATATLTGRVTAAGGRVAAGTVTATSSAGATTSATVRADGTYALAWTPTVLGRAVVRLSFAPDADDVLPTTRDVLVPVVAATATSAVAPSATMAAGAVVSLPVSVTAPGTPVVPAGTVTATENGRRLASTALVGGSAQLRLPVLVGGRHDLVVTFTPAVPTTGPTTATSSTTATVVVAPAAPVVRATLSAPDVATTEQARVAVTVTAPSGVVPTGAVQVVEGGTTLATGTLVSGRATVVLPRLPVGDHALGVAYGGETRVTAGSSAVLALEVTQLPRSRVTATVPRLTTAQRPVVTVRASSTQGAGTGEVVVSRDGVVLARGVLSRGVASVPLPLQTTGTSALVVQHLGSAGVEGGRAQATLVVAPARPVVTARLAATTKTVAQTTTVAASVTSPAGTAAGTVQLRSGTVVLDTQALVDGAATLTVPSTLPVGRRTLTVVYSGSSELTAATSAGMVLTTTS